MRIDILDKKILNILIAHAELDYSKIARYLGITTEKAHYRINRLIREQVINEFKVILNHNAMGYMDYNVFIRFKDLSSKNRDAAIDYFKKHPFIIWVGSCIGEYDFRIYMVASDHAALKELVRGFERDLGTEIDTMLILRRQRKHDGTNYLSFRNYSTPKEIKEIELVLARIPARKKDKSLSLLDDKDFRILRMIYREPKITYRKIAQTLHVTPEDIAYRVRKIESTPLISRYSISVNFPKLGLLWLSLLIKTGGKGDEKRFVDYVVNHPQTVNLIENVGEWDAEVTFYAKSIDEADRYILDLRENCTDIISDFKFFITKDGLKSPQVAEGIFTKKALTKASS